MRAAVRAGALALAITLAVGVPVPVSSQAGPASLMADQVTFDEARGLLVASGNVEVLYQGRVLRADRIIYDRGADEIRAEGRLVLTDPGGAVLLADSAALTPDLEAGLVASARLLVAGKLQLSAAELRRTGGRYNTLHRVIASSCTICAENPTPTWAIRASRVTQDEVVRRLYFEDARVELFGVPVALVPRLSIPAPGVERATGFLAPGFQQSDIYGFGVKLPYYRVLGPSADATVTPFLTTGGGALVEGEYRRRFANGGFDLWGVLSLTEGPDDGDNPGRGAFRALGAFDLRDDFVVEFDLNATTDRSFLTQYDYSDADLLTSAARLVRTRERDYFELGTVAFQSLVDEEDDASIPFVLPEFFYRRLAEAPLVGGRLGVSANSLGIFRNEGGNALRGGGSLDWTREWLLPRGILATTTAELIVNGYQVGDYPGLDNGFALQAAPTGAVELRWPLAKSTGRADHVIEPIAQVAYTEAIRDQQEFPNEDSRLPEFDDTNLFSLNRFPGLDRLETGLRANLGVSYTRYDPAGWSLGVTLGRVIHAEEEEDFAAGTGLTGRWSDYVGAVYLDLGTRLAFTNRALFGSDLEFRRNEFGLNWNGARADFLASYVYLAEDDTNPILGPQPETAEVRLDARVRVHPNLELRGLWRYDVANDANLRAGAGIVYGNECAEFDLSVSRRYTSSSNVPPSTSIGFSLRLAGIGEDQESAWPARVCMAQGT
jgi:LPS-assembly protein